MLTPESVLEGLTAPQRAAATHIDGPLLVLAGAGSGKTRTITRRIAYMVACGIPAWNILAITFTNKAAGEMRQRVQHLLQDAGPIGRGVTVCTFHGLCARLLREFAAAADLPKTYTIYDSSDQSKTVKQAIKDCNVAADNFPPATVLGAISKAKNKLQSPEAFAQTTGSFFEKNVARIYARYEQILTENKAVDFDDLLFKMAVLLRDNREVREQLQDRFQYILIDEYQDTNHAQFILAHMLAMNHKNICATGDPDQSIYGWRGANLNNILEFEQFYPNAKVVLLEQNYRSTKVILQAASALIANNAKRKKKDLWTENENGPRIQLLRCGDEHQEATEVIRRIKAQHDENELSWDQMAIFYRVNSLSRVLEDALMKLGIPYQIARGTEFYARKEIKDVLSYLRVISNPGDNLALERIANIPARGLGETSLIRIGDYASQQHISLLEACRRAEEVPDLTTRAMNAAVKLAALFDGWIQLLQTPAVPPFPAADLPDALRSSEDAPSFEASPEDDPLFDPLLAAAEEHEQDDEPAAGSAVVAAYAVPGGVQGLMDCVVKESGLESDLKKQDSGDDGGNDRLANVAELISVAAEFDAQNPQGSLDEYLQQVTLVSDVDKIKDNGGAVTLMTLHAAKGLEFPFVAIVGMEDGLLPHARAVGFAANPDEMEEERRLAFVGITRAMKQLVMSCARYRMIRGQTERTIASQFLSEIPREVFDELDLTGGAFEESGSVGYRDESSFERRSQGSRRTYEAQSQRAEAQMVAGEFKCGMLVRHSQFGLGRIEELNMASAVTVRVVVRFQNKGRVPLILPPARLERVDA